MKNKILIMTTLCSLVAFSQTQWITPTGALEAFSDGLESTSEVDPVTEETSLMAWDAKNSTAIPNQHAFRGIYWSQSDGTDTSLVYKSQFERLGNGKLTYKLTQQEGATKPIRISFGAYADTVTATKSKPFTLDLSQNSKLELKFINASWEDLMVSLKLKDINDVTLQTYNEYLEDPDDSSLYKYLISNYVPRSGLEETYLVVDFSQTNGSEYVFSPLSTYGCYDLPLRKNMKQTGFDFTQVKPRLSIRLCSETK